MSFLLLLTVLEKLTMQPKLALNLKFSCLSQKCWNYKCYIYCKHFKYLFIYLLFYVTVLACISGALRGQKRCNISWNWN